MKKVALTMTVGAMALAWTAAAYAQTPPVPDWMKSIVKIWVTCDVRYNDGTVAAGQVFSGTGTVLTAAGKVVSAAHVGSRCISGTEQWRAGPVTSVYAEPTPVAAWTVTRTTQLLDPAQNVRDLALFQISGAQAGELRPIVVATDSPVPGDPIRVVGFSDLPFEYLPVRQAGVSVLTTNLISAWADGAAYGGAAQRLHYSGAALPGMSGGPVLNARGQLIGVHSTRTTANINDVLNTNCSMPPAPDDTAWTLDRKKTCYGNAVLFEVPLAGGGTRTQTVNVQPNSLKTVLDNYAWATGAAVIPTDWRQ